jgi:tetratricopeptide (TPR) repeat protein
MALLIASVFGNFTGIFNLVNIFRQTNKVRSDYAALWLALIVLGVGFGFARHGLRTTLLTGSPPLVLLCYALDGFLQIWLALVVAHLLGYLYFQNRFKLAWFPEFEDAPEFLVAGKAADMRPDDAKFRARMAGPAGGAAIAAAAGARAAAGPPGPRPLAPEAVAEAGAVPPGAAEKVAQGNFFIEHGSYDQALESFREALAEDPDNMGALRGLAQAGFRLDDHATVGVAGKRLGAELARQRAFEALWDMYQDYKNEIPAFTFEPDDLQSLSRWLEGEGQELAAARLLRELAVTYPDHADAPAALLRCGELLDAKCGMADTAGKVWQALVERYPESEAAGKAREFLARNK